MNVQDDDEEDLDDSEAPDDADLDDADAADETPCPLCGKVIYEQAQRCPHCGSFVSAEHLRNRKPLWFVVGLIVCLIVVLLIWLLREGGG
jgi:predicted nucleic acid-binding Zn ribbon protein